MASFVGAFLFLPIRLRSLCETVYHYRKYLFFSLISWEYRFDCYIDEGIIEGNEMNVYVNWDLICLVYGRRYIYETLSR